MPLRDYEQWLRYYDDPKSSMSWRLRQVQTWLREDLDRRTGPLRVLSVCAGDGRDIIEVLAGRDDEARVRTVLLEAHPRIAQLARERAAAAGLTDVEVCVCDAAETDAYVDAVPADLVLLVGVFGNISEAEVRALITSAPQFCTSGATVLWSLGRDGDDHNEWVRDAFTAAGFSELAYVESELGSKPALGMVRFVGTPEPLVRGRHLFTFWR